MLLFFTQNPQPPAIWIAKHLANLLAADGMNADRQILHRFSCLLADLLSSFNAAW